MHRQSDRREDAEVAVTFRLPARLKQRVEARMRGQFSSTSEYLRALIRKDLGDQAAGRITEDVSA